MTFKLKKFRQNTFSSLGIHNFRLYFIGQVISTSGTFMQGIAQELHRARRSKAGGGFLEGFRYILSKPILRITLIMMAIIGTLTYEFQVSLPLLAQTTFHDDARSYAALTTAMGVGSIFGGMIAAGSKKIGPRIG